MRRYLLPHGMQWIVCSTLRYEEVRPRASVIAETYSRHVSFTSAQHYQHLNLAIFLIKLLHGFSNHRAGLWYRGCAHRTPGL